MIHVYIAGPYSDGETAGPEAQERAVRRMIDFADRLVAEYKVVPYIPLLSHHWHAEHEHDYEFWMAQCLAWVERCDVLVRLPGSSAGADREVALARKLGKPTLELTSDSVGSEFVKMLAWVRNRDDLVEALAALEHEQWAHWTRYFLGVLGPLEELLDANFEFLDGPEASGQERREAKAMQALVQWRRQIDTPYAELSEAEKESDREWARKVLALVNGREPLP